MANYLKFMTKTGQDVFVYHDKRRQVFDRALHLPPSGEETFFLWGPRQTGKSTLLKGSYPNAVWIDLLQADQYRRLVQNPELLREQLAVRSDGEQVVVDEIQKVPALLDEVHWLHENRGIRFALCGSSARKVRRGHANLLGGRALRYELFGLTAAELGPAFDLDRLLNHGYLPRIYESSRPDRLLRSYVGDYLKEEVAAEGLVRNLSAFSSFLTAAALADAEQLNFATIARDCGVAAPTVRGYFEILEDTLLGRRLRAYTRRPKRRVIATDKFYFADVGVASTLARRGRVERGGLLYGKAFENWVFHELVSYDAYAERSAELAYWRLAGGAEVDFIIGDMAVAIEAKGTARITSDHLRHLRTLVDDHPHVGKRIVVCLEATPRRTDDGILVLPASEFATSLAAGDIF